MLFCLIFGGFAGAAVQRSMTPMPPLPKATATPEPHSPDIVTAEPSPKPTGEPKAFEFRRESAESSLFVVPVQGAAREPVKFAIDTGAEITIVREQDAAAMGAVPTDLHDREVIVIGSVMPMKGATVPAMRVAGVDLGETEILIGPDTLPFSLLGQKEIARLGAVEFDGDVMTVRPSRNEESMD